MKPSRSSRKLITALLVLSVPAAICFWYFAVRSHGTPNVIIITLDTTRADYLGCYGNDYVKTPYLDSLALDGVLFENCYNTTSCTRPSHASIFTSLYVKDHGLTENSLLLADFPFLMPKVFKTHGYNTAAFWSASIFEPKWSNFQQGYDEYFPCVADAKMRSAADTNKVIFKWLDRREKDKPFFMWVHYFEPHARYTPPPPYDTMYKRTSGKVTDILSKLHNSHRQTAEDREYYSRSTDLEYYRDQYAGEISYMDRQVGSFIQKLKDMGLYKNSVIVVVADHGESLGEHGIYFNHVWLYDQVVKVPCIYKPVRSKYTGRRGQLASTVDIYPTVFELAGISVPGKIRGKSLVDILKDKDAPECREMAFAEHEWQSIAAIITHKYKFLKYIANRDIFYSKDAPHGEKGKGELYDLLNDPGEQNDIYASSPDVAAMFDKEMDGYLKDRWETKKAVGVKDPAFLKTLKSLGYVQ